MTSTRSEIVEAMAIGMFDSEVAPKFAGGFTYDDPDVCEHYRDLATAALTALLKTLGECGWKVVPVRPDVAMLDDGQAAYKKATRPSICGMTIEAQTFAACARELACWHAMIAAAPELLQVEE